MNEKLSLQDLVEILSKKANITKKEADLFFRELFQLILDRIFDNDSVKIKDFGTFKLTPVSSRESVDVNTGEKIEIPAHHRLSFSPDKTLKELVNKPFSQFETILLDEKGELESVSDNDNEEEIIDSIDSDEFEIDIEMQEQDIEEEENAKETIESESSVIEKDEIKNTTADNKVRGYSQSFSYTYTYTTKSEENDDTVVLTVPKNNIAVQPEKTISKTEEVDKIEIPSLKKEEEKVIIAEEKQEKENKVADTPVEEVVKQDIKEQIKPKEVEVKAPVGINDDWAFDSEIETEEDVSPLPIPEDKPVIETPVIVDDEKKKRSSLLDRPLLPVEDIIEDDDSLVLDVVDVPVTKEEGQQRSVYNKPIESRGLAYTESLEQVEMPSAYDYTNPSLGDKIKRRLPVILFVLVILVFAAYSFFKLFDVRYDFEDQLNRKNFRLEDSLVYLNEKTEVVENHLNDIDLQSDSVVSVKEENEGMAVVSDQEEKLNVVASTDSLRSGFKGVGKSERIISERLHIGIVNKAMHHLHKYGSADTTSVTSVVLPPIESVERDIPSNNTIRNVNTTSVAGGTVVTLGKGVTLRTLSTKYYGDPAYWVYIYQANKSKLSNPNDIAVGMKLTIPKLADYGISNPRSLTELEKARALEAYY